MARSPGPAAPPPSPAPCLTAGQHASPPRTYVRSPRRWEKGVRLGYAGLRCRSNRGFLDGASHPEELVDEAVLQGDHRGLVVSAAEMAPLGGNQFCYDAQSPPMTSA
jgi:hypothetical protein